MKARWASQTLDNHKQWLVRFSFNVVNVLIVFAFTLKFKKWVVSAALNVFFSGIVVLGLNFRIVVSSTAVLIYYVVIIKDEVYFCQLYY